MLGFAIAEGMIFHAKSQQRTRVDFDSVLRDETIEENRLLHDLLQTGTVPPAEQ